MKKVIVILSLVGSLLIMADTIDVGHWIVLFVLAGVIPGTNISIAPVDVMAAVATAVTVVVLRITLWHRVRTIFFTPPQVETISRSKRASRRTA